MKETDFRSKTASTQFETRMAAIKLLKCKRKQSEVAEIFSLRKATVCRWWKIYREEGKKGLRGRRLGEKRRLHLNQEREINRLITDKFPEQLKLPFVLWTREAVRDLIRNRYSIETFNT